MAVRSEMKHGSSQRHVVWTLNRRYARVDDQESINYQTMTPDTFVFPLFFPDPTRSHDVPESHFGKAVAGVLVVERRQHVTKWSVG